MKEATIETFAPGEAGYCCVHGSDPTWQRRQPCVPRSTVSATAVASRDDRKTVRFAGQLAANMAADFLATGSLPHAGGWYVRGTTAERFSYAMQPHCPGPHDRPCSFEGVPLVCVPLPARALTMAALLEHVGIGGYYADRELAWFWSCQVCGQLARRLHAVHPAPMCSGCGHRMRASLERASGLTAAEMADLSGNAAITLADLGLTDETLVRCAARDGEITWIQLEEPHDQPA